MKVIVLIGLLLASFTSYAGARTNWAVPTQINIVRGEGVMVYGDFGNPNNCTKADLFFIKSDHPSFDRIYSTLMTAYLAKKEVKAYIHECQPVLWYSVVETTYNTLTLSGDFQIK